MCCAAKEVSGTPPEKLNSDFGAKMVRLGIFFGRSCGMRAVAGGGLHPEILGDFRWRFPIEKIFALEISNGDFQWRFSMEILD